MQANRIGGFRSDIRYVTNSSRIIVAGHRGFRSVYPENTIISLEAAVRAGAGMVEFDIGLSLDAIPVLCHDPTLDRTTTGTGLVKDYTYDELGGFDAGVKKSLQFAGTPIPSFEEVCQWALQYPALLLNVDMKSGDTAVEAVDPVLKLIYGYGLQERCVINSGDGRVLSRVAAESDLMLEGGVNHFDGDGTVGARLDAVCLHITGVNEESVAKYRDMGKLVWCWGADDEQSMNWAIDCNVTLLVCDDPAACIALCVSRGLLP